MQAQEPRPPFIGLWTRLRGFRREDLHRALHERTIVRGTLMRGTLHLLSAADYVAHRMTLQPVLTRALALLGERAAGLDIGGGAARGARASSRSGRAPSPSCARLWPRRFPDVNDRALGFTVRMQLPLVMIPTEDRWAFPADSPFRAGRGVAGDAAGRRGERPRRWCCAIWPRSARPPPPTSSSGPVCRG